jgi:hypothetical protein
MELENGRRLEDRAAERGFTITIGGGAYGTVFPCHRAVKTRAVGRTIQGGRAVRSDSA